MRFRSRSRVFGLVMFILFFSSCDSKKNGPVPGRPRTQGTLMVDAFLVQPSALSENVEVPGTLFPFEETQIRAETGGRIVQLNIQEGATVSKGTLLVKIFDRDLQAQLQKLQVQLQINEKTEERNRELLKINAISQQDYDLSSLNVENLRADIEAVRILHIAFGYRSHHQAGKSTQT
jgi:membrane fusion protein, multidrug efflux system